MKNFIGGLLGENPLLVKKRQGEQKAVTLRGAYLRSVTWFLVRGIKGERRHQSSVVERWDEGFK